MRIDDPSTGALWVAGTPLNSSAASPDASEFTRALDQAKAVRDAWMSSSSTKRTLKPNDTLTKIVRQEASDRGLQLSPKQEYQAVLTLARDNQLNNPNRIWADQTLNMGALRAQLATLQNPSGTGPSAAGAVSSAAISSPNGDTALQVQPSSTQDVLRVVKARDTLTEIVRQEASQRGISLNQAQIYKEVLSLAKENDLSNPDQIRPGQALKINQLQANLAGGSTASAERVGAWKGPSDNNNPVDATSRRPNALNATPYPVLRQTLDRAVARGFIPANEKQDVYNKILQVAHKHRFSPDDFARMTLMESDGMNPQATNQRCHGIIQFCEGPAQGAAGVGYGQAPKAILNLSVYQQLHLVDTYFDKVGLKKQGPVRLDDLYLAVLQPAARAETRPEVPLEIPGNQAHALYEGRNPQAPITRNSIIQGLLKNTMDRLGMSPKSPTAKVSSSQSRMEAVPVANPTPSTGPENL